MSTPDKGACLYRTRRKYIPVGSTAASLGKLMPAGLRTP